MNNFGYVVVSVIIGICILSVTTTSVQKNTRNNFCNNTCICRNQANNSALANSDSCTQYFTCIDGYPQPKTCPTGQWFNTQKLSCDSSKNDKCNPSEELKCPPQAIYFYPHEEFCDKYIMCFAGFPILSHCADGLYFDRDTLKCDSPEKAECQLEVCPTNTGVFELIFLPSDVDCEKYYICYNGNPMEQYCAPGIHWNPKTDQCDFAENVHCTYAKPDEPLAPEPYEIPCKDGIYFEKHPNSCEHYFICSAGISVMLDCAPGFQIDNKNNWCDYPLNVHCEVSSKTSGVLAMDENVMDVLH